MKSIYRTGSFDLKKPQHYQMDSFVIFTVFVVARDLAFVSNSCMHAPNEVIPQKLKVPSSYTVSYS